MHIKENSMLCKDVRIDIFIQNVHYGRCLSLSVDFFQAWYLSSVVLSGEQCSSWPRSKNSWPSEPHTEIALCGKIHTFLYYLHPNIVRLHQYADVREHVRHAEGVRAEGSNRAPSSDRRIGRHSQIVLREQLASERLRNILVLAPYFFLFFFSLQSLEEEVVWTA